MKKHFPTSGDNSLNLNEILDCITDAIYAVDSSWRLTYVNHRCEEYWNRKRDDLIGTILWDMFPNYETTKGYKELMRAMRERIPQYYETFSPNLLTWVKANIYPTSNGALLVYFRDITECKEAEKMLSESEKRQAFLLRLNDALRVQDNPVVIQETATRLLVEHMGISQANYNEYYEDSGYVVNRNESFKDTGSSLKGSYFLNDCSASFQILHSGSILVFNEVLTFSQFPEIERERVAALGIRALISVPLIKNGKLVATLTVRQSTPREWTPLEISLVQEAAEGIWAAMERARVEEAHHRSEDVFRALLNSTDDAFGIWEVIFEGERPVNLRHVVSNQAAVRMTGMGEFDGKTILDIIPGLESYWIELWGRVAKTGIAERYELPAASTGRVYSGHIFKIGTADKNLVAGITQDITARKQAEETLRKIQAQLEKELADTKLLQNISTELMQEDDIQALYERIIDAAMLIMQSDFASIQMRDPSRGNSDELRMLTFRGFSPEAAKFWEWVGIASAGATCGEALRTGKHIIVPDVEKCEFIQGTEDLIYFRQLSIRSIYSTPLYTRSGRIVGMLSTHWREPHQPSERELCLFDILVRQAADIIERIINEEKIKEQKDHLEALISVLSECSLLSIVDKDGNYIKYSNLINDYYFPGIKTVGKVGGTYREGLYFNEMGNELSYENIPVKRVLRGERISAFQFGMKTSEGVRDFVVNGIPVFDEQGKVDMGILITFDITEQVEKDKSIKNQQESIIRLQQEKNDALLKSMEMKDEFLSLISHEFKTPITVINSAVQAMRLICRDELSEKGNGFLNKILQNSNRQLKLVNNLLDITRINAGRFKINLSNTDIIIMTRKITESIMIYADQKRIRLSFSSTLGEKIIGIDEEKYERILLNLLSNAIKFTPEGKSIFVRVSQKVVKGKCKVCIQVKDQGIGIPKDKQQLIFERFGQVDSSLSRQAEGTGIGLALVKMFVEIMSGEITVESEEGKGSIFTILFPVTKIKEAPIKKMLQGINDNRLIQATAIEFSDIY